MKKIISTILCISLLSAVISIPVSATEDIVSSRNIESFCQDVNEMVHEYGDSEFVTPEFIDEEQIVEGTEEEIEINYCPRLIVQSDKPVDTYNAIDIVSGFSNFYILQFENEEDTNYAYEQYKNNPNIISVEYDISYNALLETTEAATVEDTELTYEDYKNGWYLEATGMNMVLEKYKNQNLPEIVVAVIDTGVDLNCKYFKERLIPTDFNNAGDGDEKSEQDYNGHGTMVSSVIANCTTSNVKISNYRSLNSNGGIESLALTCATIFLAVDNGADVINCSFIAPSEFSMMNSAIDYAYSKSCLIVAGAGNKLGDIGIVNAYPLNTSENAISVGASNKNHQPTYFTAYGKPVDILAPGEDMPLIDLNNKISLVDGTSFSSPFTASVYAMFYATHQTVSFEDRVRIIKNSGDGTDEKYVTDLFGSGIINPLKIFELDTIKEPVFSLDTGRYVGEVCLELSAEDGAEIYYTTDYSYPSPTNGALYTEPIHFLDEDLRIRAVAYKNGSRSNYVTKDICSLVLGTDDMFTITDDGIITGYKGTVKYLKVPEIINGITVKEIAYSSGFNKAEILGIILPDTVEYLGATFELFDRVQKDPNEQISPFFANETLEFIVGNNIKVLGYFAFLQLKNVIDVDFPNCERIMMRAFYECLLLGANFPKVKSVGKEAFCKTSYISEIHLPNCKQIGSKAFYNFTSLGSVYAPKADYLMYDEFEDNIFYEKDDSSSSELLFFECSSLTEIDLPKFTTIGTNAFKKSAVKRLELSTIEYMYDLPNTLTILNGETKQIYSPYYCPVSVELSLPSTLQYCVPATDYKNEYIEYVVYGTAGINSYAEQWARENNIEFINISQETAIVKDIEPVWDKYSYKPLEFDARGFNRTYQWYGSKDKIQGNYDDKPITNATDKTFNPDDSKPYPYYYCVMTSTDKDIDGNVVSEVTVTSSMCENRLYYMFVLPDTHINFDGNLIYTKQFVCRDFLEIVHINENTNYLITPSYEYKNNCWYGTGSQLQIQDNDSSSEIIYTLIVEGDINGDSAVDVLDASQVAMVSAGLKDIDGVYKLAADSNLDDVVDVVDYQAVVNMVVS